MQGAIEAQTAAIAVGAAGSVATLLISLWNRAAVAETRNAVAQLRAEMAERQEERCFKCRGLFVCRSEFDTLLRAAGAHEGNKLT